MLLNVVFNHWISFIDDIDVFKSKLFLLTVLQRLEKPFYPSFSLGAVRPYRIDAKKGQIR